MINALHFTIKFDDLDFEKQEAITSQIVKKLRARVELEGAEALKKDWHDPKPQNWQEAFIRTYAIGYIIWDEYEKGKEERPADSMFEQILTDYLQEKAEEYARRSFRLSEVEVAI